MSVVPSDPMSTDEANKYVEKDWDKYLNELHEKLLLFKKTKKECGSNFSEYGYQLNYEVRRFDRVLRDLENYFELNKLRTLQYDLVLNINSVLHEIYMPAERASDLFSSLQTIIKLFKNSVKISIVNILNRGKTICFGIKNENFTPYFPNHDPYFDQFILNLTKAFNILKDSDEHKTIEKLDPLFDNQILDRNSFLDSICKLRPGKNDQSYELSLYSMKHPIVITRELCNKINTIKRYEEEKTTFAIKKYLNI